ncbi:MAG: hypothetical protein ABSC56_13710 [Solirubrobacteraceae bacterium]|jgi:hypothetical protein
MPTFCRHGTLIDACPICRGGAESERRAAAQQGSRRATPRRSESSVRSRRASAAGPGRLIIRRETRAADDGFRSPLAPGLRSSADAERLAVELGRASGRLAALRSDPPGLYAEVAREPEIEEATWLAFLIAYIGPLEGADPFAAIGSVRTSWSGGELPALDDAELGPRSAHEAQRGAGTVLAYKRFAQRAGSQSEAFTAEPSWSETQRFERLYERLALPGLHRRARYDLLVTLGALGRYPLSAASLLLSEDDTVNRAAKRVFGIGDRLTLERRVRELADAAEVPVSAFDLGLENWAAQAPSSLGVPDARDDAARERVTRALGL